jgi:hypothetical protein
MNRDRQKRDSEVIVVWCLLLVGALTMMMLFGNMVMNILHYIKN